MNQQSFSGQGIGLPGFSFLCLLVRCEQASKLSTTMLTQTGFIQRLVMLLNLPICSQK
jgi:hypothetical protein